MATLGGCPSEHLLRTLPISTIACCASAWGLILMPPLVPAIGGHILADPVVFMQLLGSLLVGNPEHPLGRVVHYANPGQSGGGDYSDLLIARRFSILPGERRLRNVSRPYSPRSTA